MSEDPTEETVIRFDNVSKEYKLFKSERQRLISTLFHRKNYKIKLANDNINLFIQRGASVAIFGRNGAGKSTLLKMVTGVVFPTRGKVTVNGRVSAILELTAGFDEVLSGRENIYLKGMILGMKRAEIVDIEKEIVDFADIGDYIDQPVRTYSSGMKARLGFAINTHIDPDILVIDEALSVGDKAFQRKCRKKLAEIRARENVTVLVVTHSAESARELCQHGVVLEDGKLVFAGPIAHALKHYNKDL
jgi:teichoic acid transport system ATP-binding protein